MTAGIRVTNLTVAATADSIVVIKDNSARIISFSALATQLGGAGPLMEIINAAIDAAVAAATEGIGTGLLDDLDGQLATQLGIVTGNLLYGAGANLLAKLAIGNEGQVLRAGASLPGWGDQLLVLGEIDTTTGTTIEFTGLPAWLRRVALVFDGVQFDAATSMLVQLGSAASWETTGYVGGHTVMTSSVYSLGSVSGFPIRVEAASAPSSGTMFLHRVATGRWIASMGGGTTSGGAVGGGRKTMTSTPLTRVRLTSVTGSANFNGGKLTLLGG